MPIRVIEINSPTKKQLDELSRIMAKEQEDWVKEIKSLEKELGVSYSCAMDVWYLRTRSRHTPELEKELIELHKKGQPPNMNEWP